MWGPLLGFGVLQAIFACESNMTKLARELKMDGGELRTKNALQHGDHWIFNQVQDRPTPVEEIIKKCQATRLPPELSDDAHPVYLRGCEKCLFIRRCASQFHCTDYIA